VTLALVDPFPTEVEAGVAVVARVRVECAAGCDLAGASVRADWSGGTSEGTVRAGEATLHLEAPRTVGEWGCAFVFGDDPTGSRLSHEESRLDVSTHVRPHKTSVAVWCAESPTQGTEFDVNVGVKCSAGCALGGHLVEVFDEHGVSLAQARLGAAPSKGTSALYAVDVALTAPDRPGVHTCSVRFAGEGLELPHESAQASFTFLSLEPAEHTVTVRVVLEGIEARKQGVEVRVGRYRSATDESGVARIGVPKGVHEVTFWRADLEPASTRIDVVSDVSVDLVAGPRKIVDYDAERWG
jgi:hypothetical protein